MNNQLTDIISRAIDMHVHVGPEVIPRRYTAETLIQENGRLYGAVLKNHFFSTVPSVEQAKSINFVEFGSVVLNLPAGGLNAEAVRAAATIASRPFVVWLPTIHAQNFLDNADFEIAPEWCSDSPVPARRSSEVKGLKLLNKEGRLSIETKTVLQAVADANAVLATGHIAAEETRAVVRYCHKIGLERVVITHPIYQKIDMSIADQKSLAKQGCFIETCYSMFSLDKISIEKLAGQILELGPEQVILSSDVGQLASDSPSKSLLVFCELLLQNDIPVEWLEIMLVRNPRRLLEIRK